MIIIPVESERGVDSAYCFTIRVWVPAWAGRGGLVLTQTPKRGSLPSEWTHSEL